MLAGMGARPNPACQPLALEKTLEALLGKKLVVRWSSRWPAHACEDRNVNKYLGFGDECAKKLGGDINDPNSCFARINDAFENMPLAAIITDKQ